MISGASFAGIFRANLRTKSGQKRTDFRQISVQKSDGNAVLRRWKAGKQCSLLQKNSSESIGANCVRPRCRTNITLEIHDKTGTPLISQASPDSFPTEGEAWSSNLIRSCGAPSPEGKVWVCCAPGWWSANLEWVRPFGPPTGLSRPKHSTYRLLPS